MRIIGKEYFGVGSTVLVSLLFGFAFILVDSWFNLPTVEGIIPQSTYLMAIIALFFIDIIAFIFMQLYFIYDRKQFSNCILGLAFFSGLIYFAQTFVTIQQPVKDELDITISQNDIAIYYLFHQMSLCLLIALALVIKIGENRRLRNSLRGKVCFFISLACIFGLPIVARILSSHYESYNLYIADLLNENGQIVWKECYVKLMIFMWLTLLIVDLYHNRLRSDIWKGVSMMALSAVLYNIALLFMSGYSASIWYVSYTIQMFSKLAVMTLFMCHVFSTLRVIKNIAHRDPLTHVFNRSHFFDELKFQSSTVTQTPYCVMIIDIDHFKNVNDTWGHPVGDQVIKAVADIIDKSIRPNDLLARVGGEEFGIMLTDIECESAEALAERIRANVERLTEDNIQYTIPQKVTISIGVVVTRGNALSPTEIYRLGDDALYEAKKTGRNKVVVKNAEMFIGQSG